MALFNSFSCHMPIFEKFFFYLFSCYLILRGTGTLFYAIILHINVSNYFFTIATLRKDSLAWVDILIGVSVFLIIFSFICGIYSVIFFDNSKFALVFLVLLIVQTGVAINMIQLRSKTITDFEEAVRNYGRGADTDFVDSIQSKFYCCGFYSYRDYIKHNIPIPKSCCYEFKSSCNNPDYKFGCEMEIYVKLYGIYAIGVSTTFFSICEFVGLIWALFLTNSIRKRNALKLQEMHFKQGLQFQQRNNAERF